MTVSVWQVRSGERHITCDVAVVGAGVVGAYLAFALSRQGIDVVVLEARFAAAGATGRNAGMVLSGLGEYYHTAIERHGRATARAAWERTLANGRRTRALHDELGIPYEACGSLLLAIDDAEALALRTASDAMAEDGLPAVFHPSDPLGRGFAAALEQTQDIGIDPARFTEAMLAASGATLLENCEVYALKESAGGVVLRSRLATVRAGHALLATNGYSALLHPSFQGRVLPTRAQMLLTAASPRILHTLAYANYGYEYFRQLPDGRVLMGGWRKGYQDQEIGYTDETTEEIQRGLEGFLRERFPEVSRRVELRWSGLMGFSPDGMPLVGTLPDLPCVGYAVGFTGHGLGLGIEAGEELIATVLRREPEGIFSAGRI
ncbi:MAG: FAD-binding oxidoreductase [Chloroflexota bacterium]|nr:FAD-binding oxidoreductase [Chloroflexota bacterium]